MAARAVISDAVRVRGENLDLRRQMCRHMARHAVPALRASFGSPSGPVVRCDTRRQAAAADCCCPAWLALRSGCAVTQLDGRSRSCCANAVFRR